MAKHTPSTFTFFAVLAYTILLFMVAGLVVGSLSFVSVWWLLALLIIGGIAFTGTALREAREAPTTALVASPLVEPEQVLIDEHETDEVAIDEHETDDLTRIEGIGPTISRALIAQGIDTFEKLASKTEAELQAATDAEGVRFSPSAESWAEQASYAAKGDWDGLAALQDTLMAGRYPTDDV